MDLKAKFSIEQDVMLVGFNVTGVIIGLYADSNGISYRVQYIDADGAIHDQYFFEWQLKEG